MSGGASYTFHRCLGRGGYGEVYLATQRAPSGLEKRVAVKLLKVGLRDHDSAVRRLRDEGRMLAILDHPAILGVHEMTGIEGRIALVTEYIEGTDLSRFCRHATEMLPSRVALMVVAEVAGALHTAWTTVSPDTGKPLHLVHRDIKPENIRVSKHGEVKLLDFGIARSHELSREARTAIGDIPFTPGYAAPEAFLDGRQDGPTDIFALGATLYRALVGERFYEGVKLAEQVGLSANRARYTRYVAERMREVDPDIHPDLPPLLRDMLQWDADARPAAQVVQHRAEAIADELRGPTPKRWARGAAFPDDPQVDGAKLTGLELLASDQSMVFDRHASTRTTQSLSDSPPPELTPMPPPPLGMDSVRPTTGVGTLSSLRASLDSTPAPTAGTSPWVWVARAVMVAMVFGGVVVVLGAAAAVALGLWAGT